LSDADQKQKELQLISELCEKFGRLPPMGDVNHFSADLGDFGLKWERHGEFSRFKFIKSGAQADFSDEPAICSVPGDWVSSLPGKVLVATEIRFVRSNGADIDAESMSFRSFGGNVLIGSSIAGGAAAAFTDFRIHDDGFGRLVVVDRSMTPRQSGRMIQRLVEIDTYRMMSLLALPIARELTPAVARGEKAVAEITERLMNTKGADDQSLLEALTRLAAEIDSREAVNHYRFSATSAYHALVRRRLEELREERIQGLQTFHEFIERRLSPATSTCAAIANRQTALSERVARATHLLSTRIDVTRERQNHQLLRSMNRRATLQLRLQQTVETFSVAAISYYLVGLISSAANGAKWVIAPLEPQTITAISIPVVIVLVILAFWRMNRMAKEGRIEGA